jgi:hypothetical protein
MTTLHEGEAMTGVAVDWATLSTPEFVGWARSRQLRLPFPLNIGEREWIEVPEASAIRKILEVRQLADSAVLDETASVFARPRVAVFVVRSHLDGTDERYLSIAGEDDGRAVVVVMDGERTTVRPVAEHELVAGMVGALPAVRPFPVPTAEHTTLELGQVDESYRNGMSERERLMLMHQASFSPELIALRERAADQGGTTGLVGAIAYPSGEREARVAERTVSWREYDEGALMQIELPRRRGERSVQLGGYTPDAVFRAAAELMSDLYAGT